MNTEQKRPEEWDTLFEKALELARANYQKEQDRHNIITDKAKTVFVILGLVAAFGFSKALDAVPMLARSGVAWMAIVFLLPAACCVILSIVALLHAIQVLTPREFAALPAAGTYVKQLHAGDQDSMIRALESIYQRTADKYHEINEELALRVRTAVRYATLAALAAVLFFVLYCVAGWRDAHDSAIIRTTGAPSSTSTQILRDQSPWDGNQPNKVDSRKRQQDGKKG